MDISHLSSSLTVVILLTIVLLCVKTVFPYLFYIPTFFLMKLQFAIAEKLRLKILEEQEDGIIASRKHVLFWRIVKATNRTEQEILLGIKGEHMKAQVAGSSVEYAPIADNNRLDEKPFSVTMKKMLRGDVNEHASNRVNLDKGGRVKSVRDQAVRSAVTVGQIAGWKNLTDDSGNALKFDPTKRTECYDMLPVSVQEELEMVFGSGGYDADTEDRLVRQERKRQIEKAEEDKDYEEFKRANELDAAPEKGTDKSAQHPSYNPNGD